MLEIDKRSTPGIEGSVFSLRNPMLKNVKVQVGEFFPRPLPTTNHELAQHQVTVLRTISN
jgi:hypothetical protein